MMHLFTPSHFDILRTAAAASASRDSGYDVLRKTIETLDRGAHTWPSDGGKTSLYYAIYVEPGPNDSPQPSPILAPRLYYVFDLGWPVTVVGWFNYRLVENSDNACVGDIGFLDVTGSFLVGAAMPQSSFLTTYVPGQILVAFQAETPLATAAELVTRVIPDAEIDTSSYAHLLLLVKGHGFDEPTQITRLEQEPPVRYAEVNWHVSLITPGGRWLTRALL